MQYARGSLNMFEEEETRPLEPEEVVQRMEDERAEVEEQEAIEVDV